jgi:hypothetical protein
MPPFAALLAETRLSEISLQYRQDGGSNLTSSFWYLLIPVAAVVIGVLIYKFVDRPPAIVNTPQGMLHELCRVHRIGASNRLLLEQISEEAGLAQPATLFLGIRAFEAAVEKAGQRIHYDHRQQTRLAILRRRLFA